MPNPRRRYHFTLKSHARRVLFIAEMIEPDSSRSMVARSENSADIPPTVAVLADSAHPLALVSNSELSSRRNMINALIISTGLGSFLRTDHACW